MRSASRKRRSPSWLPHTRTQTNHFAAEMAGLFQHGVALQKASRYSDANAIFRRVARRLEAADVSDASIYGAIGYTHLMMGEPDEAIEFSRKALEIDPKFVPAMINTSSGCRFKDRLEEARQWAEKALEIEPENPQPMGALALIDAHQQRTSQALVRASYALALDPECLDAIGAVAAGYSSVGDMEMSLPFYKRFIDRMPGEPRMYSAMLFSLHYKPDVTREELKEAHKTWGDRFGLKLKKQWPVHGNERNLDRRLRIGYVSGDFRQHVVGYWTKHIVEGHDRDKFEVFCFSNNKEDEYSQKFKAAADHWVPILDMSDTEAAQAIQDREIDILVDLSGHTSGNRLLMMARKPAPVQATWCGYIDSTGLEAIDYFITDEVVSPLAEPSPFVEEPLRLPTGSVCFDEIANAPEVGPLPFYSRGHITFGCFNNPAKVGPEVVKLWAEILKAVPDAKLMLTYRNLGDPFTRARVLKLFADQGIDESRIQLRRGKRDAALRAYAEEIDLALDTFPYTGGTTTCEALWMGVPVVALYGNFPMSRFSSSLLAYAGLPALATTTPEEYVQKAIELAQSPDTLAYLRSAMRAHLTQTPLFNPKRFIEGLENAYREIFERWCTANTVVPADAVPLKQASLT